MAILTKQKGTNLTQDLESQLNSLKQTTYNPQPETSSFNWSSFLIPTANADSPSTMNQDEDFLNTAREKLKAEHPNEKVLLLQDFEKLIQEAVEDGYDEGEAKQYFRDQGYRVFEVGIKPEESKGNEKNLGEQFLESAGQTIKETGQGIASYLKEVGTNVIGGIEQTGADIYNITHPDSATAQDPNNAKGIIRRQYKRGQTLGGIIEKYADYGVEDENIIRGNLKIFGAQLPALSVLAEGIGDTLLSALGTIVPADIKDPLKEEITAINETDIGNKIFTFLQDNSPDELLRKVNSGEIDDKEYVLRSNAVGAVEMMLEVLTAGLFGKTKNVVINGTRKTLMDVDPLKYLDDIAKQENLAKEIIELLEKEALTKTDDILDKTKQEVKHLDDEVKITGETKTGLDNIKNELPDPNPTRVDGKIESTDPNVIKNRTEGQTHNIENPTTPREKEIANVVNQKQINRKFNTANSITLETDPANITRSGRALSAVEPEVLGKIKTAQDTVEAVNYSKPIKGQQIKTEAKRIGEESGIKYGEQNIGWAQPQPNGQFVKHNPVDDMFKQIEELGKGKDKGIWSDTPPGSKQTLLDLKKKFDSGNLTLEDLVELNQYYSSTFKGKIYNNSSKTFSGVPENDFKAISEGMKKFIDEQDPSGILKDLNTQYADLLYLEEKFTDLAKEIANAKRLERTSGYSKALQSLGDRLPGIKNLIKGADIKSIEALEKHLNNRINDFIKLEQKYPGGEYVSDFLQSLPNPNL